MSNETQNINRHRTWPTPGGVHPPENKQQSNHSPIQKAAIPSELVIPLSQHIGAAAKAVVGVGDKVLKGQIIGEAKGPISVPVHASSSGQVIAIEDRAIAHPSGMSSPCIVIKTDQQDQWCELKNIVNYTQHDKADLLDKIRAAGIAGMGGAGFPSAIKLITSDAKPIDTLIINGTECEPYITADDRLMRERAEQIISGIKILQYLIEPSQATLIGIENNKPEAIAALTLAAKNTTINIVSFDGKYPSGGEKQLIQILTGREVPAGGLPADIGVICQNVGTVAAIDDAISRGIPLIKRITTITGDACQEPRNLEVLIGTPMIDLLQACGFDQNTCHRLVMGGPMMGFSLNNPNVPVVKTTNCILAASANELPTPSPAQACIRCGMCSEACPASLLPQQLYWYSRSKEYEKLEALHLADCIECGACSYVCPSNIPLVQYYRASKADIREHKTDQRNAEQSKARFESRQHRLEREEEEKAAKRKARQAAAKAKQAAKGDQLDPVQAAIARAKAKKAKAAKSPPDFQQAPTAPPDKEA